MFNNKLYIQVVKAHKSTRMNTQVCTKLLIVYEVEN